MKYIYGLFLLLMCSRCSDNNNAGGDGGSSPDPAFAPVTVLSHSIVAVLPHDSTSYTQGLSMSGGVLYEGAGQYGQSRLRQVDLPTGRSIRELPLEARYFGEGVTVLNDTIYQLTWKEKVVFAYSASDFRKIKEFPIATEGWGITHDGRHLIVSDGSNNLYFYDPSTFRLLRSQGVTESGSLSYNLNELEYIRGFVYANQYQTPYILKIDPNSGQVKAKLDFSDLVSRAKSEYPKAEELNGIVYDEQSDRIYVTGKYWPHLYQVQFEH